MAEQPTYCICNGPDDGRVMIQCEKCEDWFHAECVHLSDEECEKMEHFTCPRCSGGAQKRTLDEADDEVLKKLKLEPAIYTGAIENKGTNFAVTGRLLFGTMGTTPLPETLSLKGRMKLDELLTYFDKLKHSSNSRQIAALYVNCERDPKFLEVFDNLYDSYKGAVIDKKADSDLEAYVIPVKNQSIPAFFDAGVALPASQIQHLLIVVVSPKVEKKEAAPESKEEKKE